MPPFLTTTMNTFLQRHAALSITILSKLTSSQVTKSILTQASKPSRSTIKPQQQQQIQQRRSISSSSLTIETKRTATTIEPPQKEELKFGSVFSDHMLMINWNKETDWDAPRIVPYQNISLSPAASVLNYALTCFEGMKAYKSLSSPNPNSNNDGDKKDGDILLFRPDKNMERLERSMQRLEMASNEEHPLDKEELLKCIIKLIQLDGHKWIPYGEGYSLYIRPVVIGTHPFLGVAPPNDALLYVISSPVGPYYPQGFQPVRLTADVPYIRAWPGGSGYTKVGANYAPTLLPSKTATNQGYDQVLWLFDDYITEVGTMNVFFALLQDNGNSIELVTPPLTTRGDILPGITRLSIIELVQQWSSNTTSKDDNTNDSTTTTTTTTNIYISERDITMTEIQQAVKDNTLLEAFGAGTAAVVSPISCIRYKNEDLDIPATGPITKRIWKEITDIQYGKEDHEWSVKI